jgi:NitT/TauT family transport system permease protein
MALPFRGHLNRRAEVLLAATGLGLVAAIWCLLTYGGLVARSFLPTPDEIWAGWRDYDHRNWLWPSVWRSSIRVSKALGLVIAVGVPVGLLMGAFKPIDALLQKIVSGAKSVPTTAITGVVILWFGIDEVGKIVFLFLGAIFFMILMVRNAVTGVPDEYIGVALDLGAKRHQLIWQVLLPGALPRIWEAVIVCNGIMWTYIVLAEFINSNEEQLGLGFLLQIGNHTFNPGKVFGALILIALISSVTDFALQAVRRRWFRW